jgi:cytochrome c peroxidase
MIAALSRDECYRRLFARAYPGQRGAITLATITAALASFERTLVSLDSPYDRFMRGDAGAISPQAKAGLALFVGAFAMRGLPQGSAVHRRH